MLQGKRKRRIFWAAAILLGFPCVLWLAFPVWFPWILRPLATREGIHYSSYEHKGYRRFVVRDVALTNGPVQFHAARAEAWVPTIWLWRVFVNKESWPTPSAVIENWQLDVAKSSNTPASRGETNSFTETAEKTSGILERLAKWAPAVHCSNGLVRVPAGAFAIPSARWAPTGLVGEIKWLNGGQDLLVELKPGKGKVTRIQL